MHRLGVGDRDGFGAVALRQRLELGGEDVGSDHDAHRRPFRRAPRAAFHGRFGPFAPVTRKRRGGRSPGPCEAPRMSFVADLFATSSVEKLRELSKNKRLRRALTAKDLSPSVSAR